MEAFGSESITSSFGLCTGKALSSAAFNTLKIAVFRPMARAKVRTAIAVEPGLRSSNRKAKRRSCRNCSQTVHLQIVRVFSLLK